MEGAKISGGKVCFFQLYDKLWLVQQTIMTYLKILGLLYNQYGANEYVGLSVSASRRTWIQKVHILWLYFYTSIESPCSIFKMDTLACSYNKYVWLVLGHYSCITLYNALDASIK
jgi:hypothetical protein